MEGPPHCGILISDVENSSYSRRKFISAKETFADCGAFPLVA
jgi:hypothetical protein